MTVSTIYAPIEYAGDASTVAFPVPWMFLETDDLRLTKIDDATDAETAVVTFATTGAGEPTGGTAILPAAIGTGFTLRIERRTDRTQEMDLQPQGRFPAESLERSVDKLTLIVQELEADDGSGGGGTGTAIETIVTDDPTKVEIVKTGTEVKVNVLATNPTGPAGGDLAGTYPDPILKQGTGVGSSLVRIETDFSWSGWAGGSTLGGRGISPGYAWFGDPGSQVHLPVWGAADAYATLYWTRDYWATTVTDSSLAGIIGVGTLEVKPPCMAYVEIGGVWCWVLTSDSDGRWWYAQDIAANYNPDGTLEVAAWVAGTTATRVMADIATSTLEGVSCMVGNHSRIIRTTDWTTWTDVHNTGGPVIGGIATDNDGTWIAVERDTGLVLRSVDTGLTWTNPTIQKRTGESGAYASSTTLIPTGNVIHGNGIWLVTTVSNYAYSTDGIYWTVEAASLGAFYGVGFDGTRWFATNPNNGTDPAIIYQLLVSSIPMHRQVVAEKGIASAGPDYFRSLPNVAALGTDQNGKHGIAQYKGRALTQYLDGITYLCPEPLGPGLDDSLAIQAVIDLANAEGGGRVMLCAGRTYFVQYPVFVMGENVSFDGNGVRVQSDMGDSSTRSVGPMFQVGNCREWNRNIVDTRRNSLDLTGTYTNVGYTDPSPGVSPFNYPEDDGSWTVEARNCHFIGNGAILEFVGTAYKHGRYAVQISNAVDCTKSDYLSIGAGQAWGLGSDVAPNTPYAFRCHVWGVRAIKPAQGYTYYSNGFGGYGKYCTVRDCVALEAEVPYRPPYYTTADWTTGETVAVDDLRKTEVYYYRATTPGVCGATPPTHDSGTVSDGAVDWALAGRVVGQHGNLAAFSLVYDSSADNVGGVCGNWTGGNNQGWLMYVGARKSRVTNSFVDGSNRAFCSGNNTLSDSESNLYQDCTARGAYHLMQINGKNCRHVNVRGIGTVISELLATNVNGASCEFDSCDLDRIIWPDYNVPAWVTGETVAAGATRQNRGTSYTADGPGTTAGTTGPTHASGSASDGGVSWTKSRSLADVFLNNRIRNPRTYTGACRTWEPGMTVSWGEVVKNAAGDKAYCYTTPGVTGATEPSHTNKATAQVDGTAKAVYHAARKESLENIYFGWDRFIPLHSTLGSAGISSIANQNSVDLATYVGNVTFRVQLSQLGLHVLKAFTKWGTFAAGSDAAGSVVTINVYRRAGFSGNRTVANHLLYSTTKSPAGASLEDWEISKDSLPIVGWYDNQYSEIWMELVWTNPVAGSYLKHSRITGTRR